MKPRQPRLRPPGLSWSSFGRGAVIFIFVSFFLFFISTYIPVPPSMLSPLPVISLEIRDRNGVLLREVLSEEGGRCRWTKLKEISPYLIKATIAAEDKIFPTHPGVNPASVLRAIAQNLKQGRIVSGASTITQQLAKNLLPGRRHVFSKLRETWLALRLEHYLSKERILEEYLNRVYYGNQAYGAEAASRLYFGKPCSELTLAEASFLASLPRSPSLLNPYRIPEGLKEIKKRQVMTLKRLTELGFCQPAEAARAQAEEVSVIPAESVFRAPHFCEWLLSQLSAEQRRQLGLIQTTLDYSLQTKIESLLRQHLHSLRRRGITNGAVIVLENATGDILSMVGSKDFFDPEEGQVNGALARRQPGSTLKPFTYALSLEKGLTAASIIEDSPASFPAESGTYVPLNFDRQYHGRMSLRTALACSYNVPAVSLASWLSPELLFRRLKEIGFDSLKQGPNYYGLGLTLGNGEVTLLELVRAYATLARQGTFLPERIIISSQKKKPESKPQYSGQNKLIRNKLNFRGLSPQKGLAANFLWDSVERPEPDAADRLLDMNSSVNLFSVQSSPLGQRGKQVFSPQVAYIITDILADPKARVPSFGYITPLSFPFPVAVKTGTSEDFRDNWTVGFTPRYTVGVWVGNFNGEPMANVSGITGSGPLFHDIMLLLHPKNSWSDFDKPDGLVRVEVCPESGELRSPFCPGSVEEIFIRGTEPRSYCPLHASSAHKSNVVASNRVPAEQKFSEAEEVSSEEIPLSSKSLLHKEAAAKFYAKGMIRESASSLSQSWLSIKPLSFRQKSEVVVISPQDGDIFKIDPVLPPEHQRVKLRASVSSIYLDGGILEWYIDGQKIGETRPSSGCFWRLEPGVHQIKVRLRYGSKISESQAVIVRVLGLSKPQN